MDYGSSGAQGRRVPKYPACVRAAREEPRKSCPTVPTSRSYRQLLSLSLRDATMMFPLWIKSRMQSVSKSGGEVGSR
jgi:hypothetical protein